MRRIGRDDAQIDRIGEDAAEKADGPRRSPWTAFDDRLAPKRLGFFGQGRLAGHDILESPDDIGLGQILDPASAEQRNEVPLHTPDVGADGAGLLGSVALAEYEPCSEVGLVQFAQPLDRYRLVVELPLLCGIFAFGDATELHFCFGSGEFRRPHTVESDRVATCSSRGAILDQIAASARGKNAQPEARNGFIPYDIVLAAGLRGIYHTLAKLGHFAILTPHFHPIPRKHSGSS